MERTLEQVTLARDMRKPTEESAQHSGKGMLREAQQHKHLSLLQILLDLCRPPDLDPVVSLLLFQCYPGGGRPGVCVTITVGKEPFQ